MGVVWRGRDKISGAPFAVKVLRSEYSADPDAVTRFVRERTVLMKFRHPAVVSVHDMIVEGDQLALVMDLVEGGDLNVHRQRSGGRLPWLETVRIGAQICDGLDAAHQAGIIHRDLKPANVLLAGGQVRLADFGIARIVGDQSATTTGTVLGTAHYLAPEMLTGGQPSAALAGVAALTHLGPFGSGHKTVAGGATGPSAGAGTQPTPDANRGPGAVSPSTGSKSGHRASPRHSPSSSPSASPSPSSRSARPRASASARASSGGSATYGPELIANGSFASDTLEGWRSNGVGLVTGGGPGGANAVKLQGADEAGVFQAVYGLTPGTSYLVTGWGEAAGGSVRIGVGDTDYTHEVGGSVTSSSWTKVSQTYTLATDQTSVNVFCVEGGPYIGYCADLTFQQVHKS